MACLLFAEEKGIPFLVCEALGEKYYIEMVKL